MNDQEIHELNDKENEQEEKFYPFTNRFTFSMVMRDPAICKGLLERILPDVEFGDIRNTDESTEEEIRKKLQDFILNIETEKTLELDPNAHGVRFDALVKSTNQWAEIEMQTYTGEDIGKRSRYYLSNIDMDAFAKGRAYSELPPTYVIFICTFDYMKQNKPVYFFQYYDTKNNLYLDDETYIIILNTKCNLKLVPEPLKPLYAYINDPSKIEDEFVEQIERRVQQYNDQNWRRLQMTLEQEFINQRKRDIAKGIEQGIEQGLARMKELYKCLKEQDRMADYDRAMEDELYQQELFKEFNLE